MDSKLTLKDVIIDMHQGINTVADKVEYIDNGIPIIQSKNFTKGYLDLNDVRYLGEEDEIKYIDKYNPKVGDILMANIGTIGKSIEIKENIRFLIAWNAFLIRPNNEVIVSSFLKYYFDYLFSINYYEKLLSGGTVKFINKKKISDILLPIYSIAEQKEIANQLDTLQSIITHRQKQLEKLDLLIKARFVEMFGDCVSNNMNWDSKPMSEVAPSKPYKETLESNVWLLNLDMIESQTGRIIDYLYVDKTEVGNSTSAFDEGNVLYSKLRPYLNKVVVPKQKGYATTELVPLRPNDLLNREFLAHLLRSESFVSFISEKVAGAKMPRVSMEVFREFQCILPPIKLQNQFADFVKQVDKSKVAVQKELDKTKMLFDSLMQEYFG